jgi:transposase
MYVRLREVAKRFNVHPRTIERWSRRTDLGFPPVVIVGNRRYVEVEKIEAWCGSLPVEDREAA